MYSINCRTPADVWLVLIHSRGTNLSRQLDSLTYLTADNPAGSVRCNNLGGGLFCLESVSMRHNASPPSTPLQSQRAGNNHWIKARPKSRESQIKWCVSSVLIRSALSVGHTASTSAHNRQSSGWVCVYLTACLQSEVKKSMFQTPMCHPYVTFFY